MSDGYCPFSVRFPLFGLMLAASIAAQSGAVRGEDDVPPPGPRITLMLAREPEYVLRPEVERFDGNHVPLWLQALDRDEDELLKDAAEAFIDAASMGYDPVNPEVVPRLRSALKRCRQPIARRAVAKALIMYDDRAGADLLWETSSLPDHEFRRIVWPALGTWKYEPAIAANLEVLKDPARPAPVVRLAIDVLRNARAEQARELLTKMVMDSGFRGDLRIAAADALGETFHNGLTPPARELHSRPRGEDPLSGLLAARLLVRHDDDPGIALLRELANDEITAVQAAALARLRRIRPELCAAFALNPDTADRFSVSHPDANVRQVLIESTFAIRKMESIPVLTAFLDDPHPRNRTAAGDGLFALAGLGDEFRASVEQHAMQALGHSSWRVLERASLLVAGLDYEPAADRLVTLLGHPRGEVAVASAFALKELAVEATLPAVLEQLQQLAPREDYEDSEKGREEFAWVTRQAQQLCEMLGRQSYLPGDPTLRLFIPKTLGLSIKSSPPCRASAIWALGRMHRQAPDADLERLFLERLTDLSPFMPEYEEVREASAYALGWMKSAPAAPALKQFADRIATFRCTGPASAWALEQVTGEVLPLPEVSIRWQSKEWFLRSTSVPQ